MSLLCPYPDCQRPAAAQLRHNVYLCGGCNRLSIQCEKQGQCDALNRPFMRYCRRCCDDTASRDYSDGGTAKTLWNKAGSLADSTAAIAGIDEPVDVVCLSDLPGYRPPEKTSIAVEVLQGLLVTHQCQGQITLSHPFQDATHPPLWHDLELVPGDFKQRPFKPQWVDNSPYLLFTNSRGVHLVNIWSISPEWSADSALDVDYRVLFQVSDGEEIVNAPIDLKNGTVGIITSKEDDYFWRSVAIGDNSIEPQATRLPIEGLGLWAQLVELDEGIDRKHNLSILTLATERGHWVWPIIAARSAQLDALTRTAAASDGEVFDVNASERSHNEFQELAHCVFPADDCLRWFYKVSKDRETVVRHYMVRLPVNASELQYARELQNSRGMVMLGTTTDRFSEVVFTNRNSPDVYVENGGQLHLRHTRARADNPLCILLHYPLVLSIIQGEIAISSLPHRSGKHCSVSSIQADPVLWGPWLLTAERDAKALTIRRRHVNLEGVPSTPSRTATATDQSNLQR